MVELPSLCIRVSARANRDSTEDDLSNRINAVLRRRSVLKKDTAPEDVQVELLTPFRIHTGLGFGTQFACAVAVGLELFFMLQESRIPRCGEWQAVKRAVPCSDIPGVAWLAKWSGRGRRSSIGLHGFLHGGLVLDRGHEAPHPNDFEEPGNPEEFDEYELRRISASEFDLPEQWRVVLIIPSDARGISGRQECELLDAASVHANPHRDRMIELARQCRDLSIDKGNFAVFTQSIDQYTELAGRLFENVQGGLYRSSAIERTVELAKLNGLAGVGQSSWGPTVFGFAPDEEAATSIAGRISRQLPAASWQVLVTQTSRTGANWRTAMPQVRSST